jgi:hypothetical protein
MKKGKGSTESTSMEKQALSLSVMVILILLNSTTTLQHFSKTISDNGCCAPFFSDVPSVCSPTEKKKKKKVTNSLTHGCVPLCCSSHPFACFEHFIRKLITIKSTLHLQS